MSSNYKFIDLCAGTGAFTHSFHRYSNFECVFANDFEKNSKSIYDLNHINNYFKLKDINEIDVTTIPNHDILCAGFPCQSFSIAGKKKGFEDSRANVFWKIIEILKHHSPNIVILENVKNLKSHDDGNTYKIIEGELKKAGYHIKAHILDTSSVTNVPQHRERIYIVCFKNEELYNKFKFDFKKIANKPISDFLETSCANKYYYTDSVKVYKEVKDNVVKHINENVLYQYRRYYVRENKSNCCPTLTANMGTGGHNVPLLLDDNGIRKLTPRECFNLQGFPSTYKLPNISDSGLYKLAGNAVSVPVINLIVDKIVSLL